MTPSTSVETGEYLRLRDGDVTDALRSDLFHERMG